MSAPSIVNRRASFDYFLISRLTAGLVLYGTEIKSIREGKASLIDAFCRFENGELWVNQMRISPYKFGSYANHDELRKRKLLLNRQELRRLERQVGDSGKTIIPLRIFFNEKGLAKMEIALAQGKHNYDKRQSLREKDIDRDTARYIKR
ncbi:MAG: SsrA-binding protein SmpB [Paludibacteraceae bacterium]|nr:SsrA-binding protein SmpB [Paludibacteraceae bacterium]